MEEDRPSTKFYLICVKNYLHAICAVNFSITIVLVNIISFILANWALTTRVFLLFGKVKLLIEILNIHILMKKAYFGICRGSVYADAAHLNEDFDDDFLQDALWLLTGIDWYVDINAVEFYLVISFIILSYLTYCDSLIIMVILLTVLIWISSSSSHLTDPPLTTLTLHKTI